MIWKSKNLKFKNEQRLSQISNEKNNIWLSWFLELHDPVVMCPSIVYGMITLHDMLKITKFRSSENAQKAWNKFAMKREYIGGGNQVKHGWVITPFDMSI